MTIKQEKDFKEWFSDGIECDVQPNGSILIDLNIDLEDIFDYIANNFSPIDIFDSETLEDFVNSNNNR